MGARGKSALFRDEMAQRGFEVIPKLAAPGLPGVLFRSGSRVELTDIVDARATDSPFFAGTMTGLYAEDTSLPRSIGAAFAAIPLPRPVPHILLMGTGIGMLKLAGVALGANQRLSLEGDFDRTFALYAPEGYERDALTIFAPDLMALLVDTTAGCDVELVDDWMFVYTRPGRFRDAASIDRVAAVTRLVQAKLHRQTGRYRDERVEKVGATVSPAEHAARAGRVAAEGARLKTRAGPVQVLIGLGTSAFVGLMIVRFLFPDAVPWLP